MTWTWTTTSTWTAIAAALLLAQPAAAQERPKEEELFGPSSPEAKAEARPEAGEGERPTDAEVFGNAPGASGEAAGRPDAEGRLRDELTRTDNPLQVGGLLYLRSAATALQSTPPSRWTFSAPSLADVFLDARPGDRVRGFGLVRTFYDSTAGGATGLAALGPSQSGTLTSSSALQGKLDQLWVRFDAARTVFFTAGRQHVKWGVGRFWSPTDFLHANRRNPLAGFDDRTGTTMLKAHLPWEKNGSNFYAMLVADRLVTPPSSVFYAPPAQAQNQVGAVGGAARAEVVLGSWELGIDGVAQRGMEPRAGFDFSTAIWELDVRGEISVRRGSDGPRWRPLTDLTALIDPGSLRYQPRGLRTAAVLAADWQHKYSDEDTFTIGAEYFWNENGYSDPHVYPVLLFTNSFTPFYLGQHYAGLYLSFPRPGSWDLHTFTLSGLANLSDRSMVARLDWSYTLLTWLTLETYVAGHAGARGGEFRFGLDVLDSYRVSLPRTACTAIGGSANAAGTECSTPAIRFAAPVVDVGVALRMAL
ncbi:MAG: hypothetical protein HZB56_01460 [Deltaproteobacteria bacterium]|nr:hypothetical protein [Deltaproteobacteria bacterium]